MRNLIKALVFIAAAGVIYAQAPATPAGPTPTGLVVGSGNFFSPIVSDLDKAIAFYRDGLGLDVQGAPANADANPALRNMFGLPDAQLRWSIGRPPAMRTGVEIVEIKKAESKPLSRQVQDRGAFTLMLLVRDLDAVLARLKPLGAPIVSAGGVPVAIAFGDQKARGVVVRDPDGHFVELVQPEQLPKTEAPDTANVVAVRVRLTVEDVEQATRLYRDVMGLRAQATGTFRSDPAVLRMLGLKGGQYRVAALEVPTSGLVIELIDFKGLDRKSVSGNIQDPGSTRMQLQVKDVEATVAALKQAGGSVVSTGGTIVELPGRGGNTTKVAIVRDPNNLFLVLLQAPPANPTPAR